MFGLSSLFYFNDLYNGLSGKSPCYPRGHCPWFYKISYSPTPFLLIWKNLANFPLPRGRESNQSFVFPDIFPWLARGPTPGGSRWHVHNAPFKVNPDPPPPSFWWGFSTFLAALLVPSRWGISLSCHPSRKNMWAAGGNLKGKNKMAARYLGIQHGSHCFTENSG